MSELGNKLMARRGKQQFCRKCGGPKVSTERLCWLCNVGVEHVIPVPVINKLDIVRECFEAICREARGRVS